MRLFKLVPKNLQSDVWKFSTYRGPVLVRAHDEEQARTRAAHRFVGAAQSELQDRGIVSSYTWYSPTLVSCSEVKEQHERGDSMPIVE